MTDDVLALIARLQSDPATATAYLGTDLGDPAAVAAELDTLDQPWHETLRTLTRDGRVLAAAVVEWNEEADASWVYGPWLDCPAAEAVGLLREVVAQVPVGRAEMFGDVRNTGMAEVAELAGWRAGPLDHSYAAEAAHLTLPDPGGTGIRRTTEADLEALTRLHDAEFPGSYATARQLQSDYVTVVAEDPEAGVVGYAAGQVQGDGTGYLDFTAVDPTHRRRGIAAALLADLIGRLGAPRYALTVSERHESARRLYERLGFRHTASLRAYRWTA